MNRERNEADQDIITHQSDGNNPTLPSLASINKPVLPDKALSLIRQTAVALSEASHSGFVHKNLRPETILLGVDDPSIKLNYNAPRPQPDAEDWAMSYTSPEQKEGKALDSRSNIYSLGIILHELIYGFPPEQMPETPLEKTLPEDDLSSTEDGRFPISHQTTRVIETSCRKEPWARYQTLEKFIAAVDEALLFETTAPDDPTMPTAALPETAGGESFRDLFTSFFSRDNRLFPIGITVLFLALFAFAMFNSWSRSGTSSTIPIFQQLPLLLGGEKSPSQQTREAEGATATIRALQIRLPSRTPTPFPTTEVSPIELELTPIAGVRTNTNTPTHTPTPEPTETSTNPPPPVPTETPTETPTGTPTPSPSPTSNGATPPSPGETNTVVPPPPTNFPTPTNLPQPTNTSQPTPTPPPGATPTPPTFPTSTPPPTNTAPPTNTSQPTPTPPQ